MNKKISIDTEYIKLEQLLKYSGLISTGGESKRVIAGGSVTVNGEVCLMRGKKIRPGDTVAFAGTTLEVVGK
jgi:ribosome-associated protein